MLYIRFVAVLLFMGLAACQTASTVHSPQTQKTDLAFKLSCFSIYAIKSEKGKPLEEYPSCDQLCAKQKAVCSGMQNGGQSPPLTCDSPVSYYQAVCRCCGVAS